ncbi:MAG: hypothetical protein ACRDN0_36235 [Trebonia sp.]
MQQTDFTKLDDPEFFAERRRLREQLERLPAQHIDRDALAELYEQMTDELTKRAASAWQAS